MAKSDNKFLDLIKAQRSSKKDAKFEGTLLEYMNLVKENPDIAKASHKRLSDVLEAHGVTVMADSDPRKHKLFDDENIKIYDYFQTEFFGAERTVAKIMRFLKSAALKGEESRQVLLLMGPVGAGKSAITEHIKRSIEQLSYLSLGR